MTFLDLSKRDQEIASRPSPNEGTHLPSFYELHREEIHALAAILATLVAASVAAFVLWRYRRALREAFIVTAAALVRVWRKIAAKGRELRSDILRRAE
jgi:hypothetical protein